MRSAWTTPLVKAFCGACRERYGFDPENDGDPAEREDEHAPDHRRPLAFRDVDELAGRDVHRLGQSAWIAQRL